MNPYVVEESRTHYQEPVDAAEAWQLQLTARAATIGFYIRCG